MLTRTLNSEQETEALGRKIARIAQAGDFVALFGDLGAGKTTFCRAFIREMTQSDIDVSSPTFTLVQTYEAESALIWHFDLYRLEHQDELMELGMDDAMDGVTLVEWPERMGDALPMTRLDVTLQFSPEGRVAALNPHGPEWSERLNVIS